MAKYINQPKDRFLALKDTVEGELKRTGFDPVVVGVINADND